MSKIKKNQKPIEVDAHFKYRCPCCNLDHWISLKQAKTKNYKIVCDCDTIIQPKTIKRIKISYAIQNKKPTQQVDNTSSIDTILLSKCVKVLVGYGFTNTEAENMVKKTYIMYPTNDCISLIKKTLESIGVSNYEQSSTGIV